MIQLFRLARHLIKRSEAPPNARHAFIRGDIAASRAAHIDGHVESQSGGARYLSDIVLGGIDGIITTFAVISSVEGAKLSPGVILVLGFANLFADAISLAVGNYLGAKSEREYQHSEREREAWEIENLPELETQEVRDIYAAKGFEGDLLEAIVQHITDDKELWLDTMMREELDIVEDQQDPRMVGLATFVAFVGFGFIPLCAYLSTFVAGWQLSPRELFSVCVLCTAVALFSVGALRAKVTLESKAKSGLEIMLMGGIAGSVAYTVGVALRGLVS